MRSAPWPNGFPCIWGGGFEPDFIGPPQALMGGSAWKEGLLGFFSWGGSFQPRISTAYYSSYTLVNLCVCVYGCVCISVRFILLIVRILRREAVLNKPITLYVLQNVGFFLKSNSIVQHRGGQCDQKLISSLIIHVYREFNKRPFSSRHKQTHWTQAHWSQWKSFVLACNHTDSNHSAQTHSCLWLYITSSESSS